MWKTFLFIIIYTLPFSLLFRWLTEIRYPQFKSFSWVKQQGEIMEFLKSENMVLFILLATEGVITNISIFLLVISIPIWFFFGK